MYVLCDILRAGRLINSARDWITERLYAVVGTRERVNIRAKLSCYKFFIKFSFLNKIILFFFNIFFRISILFIRIVYQ